MFNVFTWLIYLILLTILLFDVSWLAEARRVELSPKISIENINFTMLFYTAFFGSKKPEGILYECGDCTTHLEHYTHARHGKPENRRILNVTVIGTNNKKTKDQVDLVVFHLPDVSSTSTKAQLAEQAENPSLLSASWAVVYQESPGHYPRLKDETYMSQFSYRLSYRQDSAGHFSYLPNYDTIFNTWQGMKTKNATAPVIWISSNCYGTFNNRTDYVKALAQHVEVHSYGPCFHTHDFPDQMPDKAKGRHGGLYTPEIVELISSYKFYLAFENDNCQDYVTEKYWRALNAGAVPVVLGAPNIAEFAPSDVSIINVHDYPNAKALGEYLTYLHEHDDKYQEYIQYKHDPTIVKPAFTNLWHMKKNGWCEVACTAAMDAQLHHTPPGLQADDTCEILPR